MKRLFDKFRRTKHAPHFVRDYGRLVDRLVASKPLDQAMSDAVGGNYVAMGLTEAAIMRWAGLKDGDSILDFGCGSGRLAHALGQSFKSLDYVGIDIMKPLLDYARTKSPSNYRFLSNQSLSIPLESESVDFIACFSVFTHLHQAETYIYLKDMRRILKPNGKILMSFLEAGDPLHWGVFDHYAKALQAGGHDHLNVMLERPTIDVFCSKLGLTREAFVGGSDDPWEGGALGQSLAVISR